jgi:hypothetical protein
MYHAAKGRNPCMKIRRLEGGGCRPSNRAGEAVCDFRCPNLGAADNWLPIRRCFDVSFFRSFKTFLWIATPTVPTWLVESSLDASAFFKSLLHFFGTCRAGFGSKISKARDMRRIWDFGAIPRQFCFAQLSGVYH